MNNLEAEVKFEYFNWLVEQVRGLEYMTLLRHLHRRKFEYILPMDENRCLDGEGLRDRFVDNILFSNVGLDFGHPSILEVLVGIAFRINDICVGIEEEDRTDKWFWEMISNLGLDKYDDDNILKLGGIKKVDDILDRFMERRFKSNGVGGLFPLNNPHENQQNVEIWYQMSAYLDENYSLKEEY